MIRTGVLFGAAAGAFWGLVFLSPLILTSFSALEIAAGRFLVFGVASALLIAPSFRSISRTLSLRDAGLLLLLGAFGNVVFFALLAGSIQQVGIGPASLVVGMAPVVVTLLGRSDKDSLPLSALAGPLLIIVLGIVFINVDALRAGGGQSQSTSQSLTGLLMAFGALASWSIYTVLNARALKCRPDMSSGSWCYLTGVSAGVWALGLAAFIWLNGSPSTPAAVVADDKDWTLFWAVSIGIGVGGSVIANLFWNAASRRLPLSLTGQVFVFEPVFALLYGFAYSSRLPRPVEAVAIVLLVSGVLWAMKAYARKAQYS
ncbi:DMT family transporter [Marinobacter sp. ANT_B65]|uniref:DMT family transporter n=1 Tax=Marinobacter sp. ANT_B65 TaxID=2039467 RepID=UPI0015CB5638|nr:DMT family transporter [Marinobacter sp. ANT_B65]